VALATKKEALALKEKNEKKICILGNMHFITLFLERMSDSLERHIFIP